MSKRSRLLGNQKSYISSSPKILFRTSSIYRIAIWPVIQWLNTCTVQDVLTRLRVWNFAAIILLLLVSKGWLSSYRESPTSIWLTICLVKLSLKSSLRMVIDYKPWGCSIFPTIRSLSIRKRLPRWKKWRRWELRESYDSNSISFFYGYIIVIINE